MMDREQRKTENKTGINQVEEHIVQMNKIMFYLFIFQSNVIEKEVPFQCTYSI